MGLFDAIKVGAVAADLTKILSGVYQLPPAMFSRDDMMFSAKQCLLGISAHDIALAEICQYINKLDPNDVNAKPKVIFFIEIAIRLEKRKAITNAFLLGLFCKSAQERFGIRPDSIDDMAHYIEIYMDKGGVSLSG